jgi:hypothetical protein
VDTQHNLLEKLGLWVPYLGYKKDLTDLGFFRNFFWKKWPLWGRMGAEPLKAHLTDFPPRRIQVSGLSTYAP